MISDISIWSPLAPALIGLVFFFKLEKKTRWIIALVSVSAIVQISGNILEISIPKYVLYNCNIILEFFFLIAFFYGRYTSKTSHIIFTASILICSLIGVFSLWNYGIVALFLTKWLSINNLAFTMWTLLLVYEYYREDLIFFKRHPAVPYYLIGFFLYNCSTVFIFPLWDYITGPNNTLKALITIHAIFNIIMYVCISIGFCIEIRRYLVMRRYE